MIVNIAHEIINLVEKVANNSVIQIFVIKVEQLPIVVKIVNLDLGCHKIDSEISIVVIEKVYIAVEVKNYYTVISDS